MQLNIDTLGEYEYTNIYSNFLTRLSHNKIWDKLFTPQLLHEDVDATL